eukprot:scaffold49720_cov73-Phaeocystis_antarctica.AAC.1
MTAEDALRAADAEELGQSSRPVERSSRPPTVRGALPLGHAAAPGLQRRATTAWAPQWHRQGRWFHRL